MLRDDTDTADSSFDEIPTEKVDLYLRVSALAEKGEGNEKAQAERTLAKMRIRYPGIEFLAEQKIGEQRRADRREPKKPANAPKEAFWSAYTRTFESVSKILSDMERLWGEMGAFDDALEAIDQGIEASYRTIKIKGVERFRLILDIESDVLSDVLASVENSTDRRAIADHLGQKVADALAEAFGEDEDEDEDGEDDDE